MTTGIQTPLLAASIAILLAGCSPSNDDPATGTSGAVDSDQMTSESAPPADSQASNTDTSTAEANAGTMSESDIEQALGQHREAIQTFASTLQGELQGAMADGGPGNAVSVCQQVAPSIAAEIGGSHGLELGRTSLRVRNTDNEPDTWERLVLENFQKRVDAGEDASGLRYHEVVTEDGQTSLRYMQSIPTGGLCLTCHGSDLHADVQPALERLYPNDRATGFEAGDLRGAFTVRQRM